MQPESVFFNAFSTIEFVLSLAYGLLMGSATLDVNWVH